MDENTLITLTYVIRTILTLYTIALSAFMYCSFLTIRDRYRLPIAVLLLFLLQCIPMIIMASIYTQYFLKIIIWILFCVFNLHLIFKDSLPKKVLLAFFFIVLLMLSEAVLSAFAALWLGISMPTMTSSDPVITVKLLPISLFSYTLCFLPPSLFARFWPQNGSTISVSRFLILPLSQIIMMGGFLYSFFFNDRPFDVSDSIITIIMVISCISVDLIFVCVIHDLVQKKQLEEQRTLQLRHYAALTEQQRNIRSLRHDLANHLMTVNVLAQKDAAQADAYIHDLTTKFKEMTAIDFCENKIADAVLYGKHAEAAAAGIAFTVDASLSEDIGIDELDLMSLLSNLIDNALDAAKKTKEKNVSVTLRSEAGGILLKVENSISDGLQFDPKKTTTANMQLHGQGIGIVENICKKYHGSLLIQRNNHTLTASAFLTER